MAVSRNPLIAHEGRLYIGIAGIAAITAHYFLGVLFSIPLWLLFVFLMYIFRDPYREIPSLPLAIISPVDGEVVGIENCYDPYLKRDAISITMQMYILGVYSIRSPTEGKVQERWFGSIEKNDDQAAKVGRQYGAWIQTDEEDNVVLVMDGAKTSRNPRCYIQSGERVGQGQRCGFAQFGASVILYIPANSLVDVKPGDKMRAGSDILAKLVHKE